MTIHTETKRKNYPRRENVCVCVFVRVRERDREREREREGEREKGLDRCQMPLG